MPNYCVFIRSKIIKSQKYYYIVKAVKEDKKPKQKVVKYLGKIEDIMRKLRIAEKEELKSLKQTRIYSHHSKED